MNNEFKAEVSEPKLSGELESLNRTFKPNSYSVGTVWMNTSDAQKIGVKNGDLVVVENPFGKSTNGKAFVSGGMRPGVVKFGFATGGRFSPGIGPAYKTRKYTPSHNELVDPDAMSPIMGFPPYADMLINVKKA
jgi:anaerobic selenocysteine-containing dehydrogenase